MEGGEAATRRAGRVRPAKTTERYGRWQRHWLDFCEKGDGYRPYDEVSFSVAKWHLFAGYLESYTDDRDLNAVRSALNRFFADKVGLRPFVGTDVNAVIADWALTKDREKRDRGEEVGLHRVPCPEEAVQRVFDVGRGAVGERLGWAALLIVMMLAFLRGASTAGFAPGDVYFDQYGALVIVVRYVKRRPEFLLTPGTVRILPPTAAQLARARGKGRLHFRAQSFAILRRALRTFPEFVTLVSDRVTPSERNGETAASLVTAKLRELVGPLNLPAGTIMAAHSIREMAAVATFRRGGSELRATERGFWKNPQIMWTSYIEPYLWFPVSPLLDELYDDL